MTGSLKGWSKWSMWSALKKDSGQWLSLVALRLRWHDVQLLGTLQVPEALLFSCVYLKGKREPLCRKGDTHPHLAAVHRPSAWSSVMGPGVGVGGSDCSPRKTQEH